MIYQLYDIRKILYCKMLTKTIPAVEYYQDLIIRCQTNNGTSPGLSKAFTYSVFYVFENCLVDFCVAQTKSAKHKIMTLLSSYYHVFFTDISSIYLSSTHPMIMRRLIFEHHGRI